MRALGCALGALLASGCEPTFDNAHRVEELRVLAVRADPPEVGVGESVELEAFVVSPRGGPVAVRMWQCGARGGMRQGCETFDDSVDLGEGTTASFVVSDAWRERLDAAGGLPVQQVVTVTAARGDEASRAIKRVVVSDETTRNANPSLDALLLGDEEAESVPFVARPGASVRVRPVVGAGSVEAYDRVRLDGARVPTEETLFVSYYYTCGSAPNLRSGGPDDLGGRWRAPRSEGPCSLHAILRDDRGGVDFRSRTIEVREP